MKQNYLLYYAFDFDDNILFMDTSIILINQNDEEIEMSTHDFAKHRSDIGDTLFEYNGDTVKGYVQNLDGTVNFDESFRNFRDINDPDIFYKDIIESLSNNKLGPSWLDFKECLLTGSIFAILTARGHEGRSIRKGVEYIISTFSLIEKQKMYYNLLKFSYLFGDKNIPTDMILKDGDVSNNEIFNNYLDLCEFIGVSCPSLTDSSVAMNPEEAKLYYLMEFKKKINNLSGNIGVKAKIGFSDDDKKTVGVIEDLFSKINYEEFPNIVEWVVKNTNNPSKVSKKVTSRA